MHRDVRRTQGAITSEYLHDEMGRLISQRAGRGAQPAVAREYVWRRDGQLTQMTDKYTGDYRYEYDALGRMTRARDEHFAFDPAHNLLSEAQTQPLQDNRLRVYEDKRWSYDSFGNVTRKQSGRHTDQLFIWNAEHQLTESVSARNGTEQRTTYGYDAFGRRSWKRDAFGITRFIWEGNRLLSEVRGSRQHIWVYEDDSFAPLAQLSLQQGETEHEAQIFWYHNDVSGLPRELTGADGSVVWRAVYRAWGNTLRTEQAAAENAEPVYQPLRYQGQYFDAETGLHYNRFRYYDPDAGRFVSQDPIGLAGGVNLYQYAPNPLSWVDPLGLSKCHLDNPKKKVNSAEIGDIVRTPTSHPEDFIKVKGGDYKNNHTNEIWSKSNTSHSDKQGEWKVGIGKSAPKPRYKITIGMSDGKIIKVDK